MNWKLTLQGQEEAVLVLTLHAKHLAAACIALDEHLRNRLKYGELPEETYNELETAREVLRDELGFIREVVLDVGF